MTATRILAALGLGAVLAGCAGGAGGPVITNEYRNTTYAPRVLTYPAAEGGLYTEVVGRPFGADPDALARKVTGVMERAHFGNKVPLTTDPAQRDKGSYRLVALFDPDRRLDYGDVCRGERTQAGSDSATGTTTMLLTFCRGSKVISSLKARQGGLSGLDDPAFEAFLAQASVALLPPRPEDLNNDGDWTI
jgi:hypothetical protein